VQIDEVESYSVMQRNNNTAVFCTGVYRKTNCTSR